MAVQLLTDRNPAPGYHVGAKIGVGSAIACLGISNWISTVVGVACSGPTGFVRPAPDIVLTVPMVVAVGPYDQGHVPSLSRFQFSGKVG